LAYFFLNSSKGFDLISGGISYFFQRLQWIHKWLFIGFYSKANACILRFCVTILSTGRFQSSAVTSPDNIPRASWMLRVEFILSLKSLCVCACMKSLCVCACMKSLCVCACKCFWSEPVEFCVVVILSFLLENCFRITVRWAAALAKFNFKRLSTNLKWWKFSQQPRFGLVAWNYWSRCWVLRRCSEDDEIDWQICNLSIFFQTNTIPGKYFSSSQKSQTLFSWLMYNWKNACQLEEVFFIFWGESNNFAFH